jgi:polysaccharide biosynthesis transport protein
MTFNQFILILRARKLLLISIFMATVLTAVVVSLMLPKQYTATSAVLLDVKSPDPISGMVLQGMMTPTYMATQVDIIKSAVVAQRALRELKLHETPSLREQWLKESSGAGEFEDWLINVLQRQLVISPSRESNVITVSYTAADPAFAAAMANAFTAAYVKTSVDLRAAPAKQFSELFDQQADRLREKLDAAQSKLSEYQKQKGIIATDERIDVENQRLQELTAQLVAVQSMSADTSSRQAQAGEYSPEVIANGVIGSLKADLARQESRQKELSARLGIAHPQVQEAEAAIKELRVKIDQEIRKVGSSLVVNNRISQMRESQIRAAVEKQRNLILQMKGQRDEVSGMLRDMEAAQRAYDSVMARLNQTTLESQTNQTNVALLKRATPPADPSSPKTLLNTLLAIFVGLLLAVGSALLVETLDRRVRGVEDAEVVAKLPVVGELPNIDINGEIPSRIGFGRLTGKPMLSIGYGNKQSEEAV